jgi:DNA-3-methyladenine glycosylase
MNLQTIVSQNNRGICLNLLPKRFYERDPATVARDLLGKKLIRRFEKEILEGLIVETEAYFGSEDPASRAFQGMKNYNKNMWGEAGTIFIYNVHNYWMFNIVAHEFGKVGAILIRSVEPLKGIGVMRSNRGVQNILILTRGPGRLSRAFKIDKSLNNLSVTSKKSCISIADNIFDFEVGTSHRIGVSNDLEREMRFYVKANKFVSR